MLKKKLYQTKAPKKGKLLIKNTARNLFITLTNAENKVQKSFSLGNLQFPAEDLYSHVALYKLGQFLKSEIHRLNYTKMTLIFYGWTKPIKKLLRALRKNKKFTWINCYCKFLIPHNGCKKKKLKRR